MNNINLIEKKAGVVYDDASATKMLMVNAAIVAYKLTGWKLTEDSPIVKAVLDNSYMGCVDCGISDCIYPGNGVPYEEALIELRDAVEYEINKCLERGEHADKTREYFVEQGWLPK